MNKKKLAALAIVPAIGVTAFATSAFAASDTTPVQHTVSKITNVFKKHGDHKRDNTQFATDLAQILGLQASDVKAKLNAGQTPDAIITAAGKTVSDVHAQLEALHQAGMKAKLAADTASGKITQAQADIMIANMANHPRMHDMRGEHGPRDTTQFATDLAQILGLNASDVKAKLDAGTKPEDIITSSGKNVNDVMTQMKTLMEASIKARIQADVTSGKITQAQADEMIARIGKGNMGHHNHMGLKNSTTTTSTQ